MAVTASLVNNTCHPTVAVAVNSYFSSLPVSIQVGSPDSYMLEHIQIAGVWNMQKTTINNLGNPTINFTVAATVPTFPDCDMTEPFFDGMQIGWGVVAAMAGALSVIFIKKALFR